MNQRYGRTLLTLAATMIMALGAFSIFQAALAQPAQSAAGAMRPQQASGPAVVSFTLINADTDQPIAAFDPLVNGAMLNLATLPTRNLNIRANTNPPVVGSVQFLLNGQPHMTEDIVPYAFASDINGNYQSWTPTPGRYTVTAIPFTGNNADGSAGIALDVTFNVIDNPNGPTATPTPVVPVPTATPAPNSPKVTTFTLINADTDQPMVGFTTLADGAIIDLATVPTRNMNIRANTVPTTVGSVKFILNGVLYRRESGAPYALFGNVGPDYHAWTPSVGTYTLTAIPYATGNASGPAGSTLTISFTVIDSVANATATAQSATQTAVAGATQTAIAQTQTSVAGATQTSIAATQTSVAGATQTSIAATQTSVAGATQTSVAATQTAIALTPTTIAGATQTAIAGATQTVIAGATQTSIAQTQTAIAATPTATSTDTPATQTAIAGATQTAIAGATQTAVAATQTAIAPTPTTTTTPSGPSPLYLPLMLNNSVAAHQASR